MHSTPEPNANLPPSDSIQACLLRTRGILAKAGVESPEQEAAMLLQHVTGQSLTHLLCQLQRAPAATELAALEILLSRRLSREPCPYILGYATFYGRDFYVDSRVLIPRPETELLVEQFAELSSELPRHGGHLHVIDVGTGSGALAITLACESPGLEIEATDASREALQVAAANCARHGVRETVRLVQGDLLSGFRRGFAAVVANLPYVPSGAFAELSPEVRVYEPRLALDGGPDGLREIRRVIDQASEALVRNGWLLLEVGEGQSGPVETLMRQAGCWMDVKTVCDLAGVGRVVLGKCIGTDSQPYSV